MFQLVLNIAQIHFNLMDLLQISWKAFPERGYELAAYRPTEEVIMQQAPSRDNQIITDNL
jgi:hypothetical protein